MSDGWKAIKLKDFEHVITGPGESLLRVFGKAPRLAQTGPRPRLVILDAGGERRFSPLRAPADHHGVLRAAYAVPTALLTPDAQYLLETTDGQRTPLPDPGLGSARMRDGQADTVTAGAPDLEQQLDAVRQQLAEIERAREDDRRAAAASAAQAESRLEDALRRAEEAERARAAERARSETAEQRITMLERELAQAAPAREALEQELAKLRSRQARIDQELDQARDELRVMTIERDELSRQADAFDAVAVKARERASAAESARDKANAALLELETWRGELERRLADTTTHLGALKAAREADQRELTQLRAAAALSPRAAREG